MATRRTPRRPQGGFSTVELLVIVTIIGLIATIVGIEVSKTYRRWQVDGAAGELKALLEQVPLETARRSAPIFLRLQNRVLTLGPNQDGSAWIRRFTVPAQISLSRTNPSAVQTNWPEVPTGSGVYILRCDTSGMTVNPNTGAMVTAVQTLVVTHRDMAVGTLKPRVVHTLSVPPLWRVSSVRTAE